MGASPAAAGEGSRGGPPAGEGRVARAETRNRFNVPRIKAPQWVKYPVIALSLIPAAWIGFALWSDLTRDTRLLGANPVKEMEHFMGEWNIRFLVLTLAVSPVIKLTGWGWLIRSGRLLFALGTLLLRLLFGSLFVIRF